VILEGRCAKGNPGIQDGSHRLKLTDGWVRVGEAQGAEVSRGEQRGEQRGQVSHRFGRRRERKTCCDYLTNCGMGGRIARPGQWFSDARPLTLLAALSTGNHVIPVRRR
jgi:hypothetical protein